MGSRKVVKNSNSNGEKEKEKKPEEIVHKYSSKGQGPLREAVIIAGIPYFIKKSFLEKKKVDYITVDPYIEEATKRLRPPFIEECPYIPYEFKTREEPNRYLQRTNGQTIDTVYQKIKSLVRLFNDVDEHILNLLAADILGSYFQDRFSTIHYWFVVGDNGTGKSALGNTYECLGYRAVNITNATEAFWFRVFGTNEAGQVTIIAEEFDRIDEKSQVMGMLKEGYHPNAKVPRMNNENTKMDFFLPFGFKIMIAERSPNEDKAKGLLERSLPIKTYKGLPDYDIKEVRNPQGNAQRQRILDEIMELRKELLAFKVRHFKDPLPEVDVGLDGRDKELCKPLLQLFHGLGASKELLNEVENALKHFLDIKSNRKEDSHEALIYPIVANVISTIGNEVSTAAAWASITSSIEGYFDEYVDKEGNKYIKNPNVFYTSDYGTLFRNFVIKMIRDKFGAEMKHTRDGNVLTFDPSHVAKAGKIYGQTGGIQTKLVTESESESEAQSGDAGDACDALLPVSPSTPDSNSLVEVDSQAQIKAENSTTHEGESGDPLRETKSHESHESPKTGDSAFDFKFDCYECKRQKRKFPTNDKTEYENHVLRSHKGKPCYPGKADLEKYYWKAQGKHWEK